MQPNQTHPPIDALGRDLRAGDWVRLLQAPRSILNMPAETIDAFSAAIGLTLQIMAFDALGCVELELMQKLTRLDTIWLEPFCCKRSRRLANPGRFFRQHHM